MQDIRIWFEKRGRAKYISHLDLMRAMSRAVRRAALPLWYTEGFHPHPYLSFPLPLSLGQEGLREALDLRLVDETEGIAQRLNAVLPEGLRVLEVQQPWSKPGEIKAAEYEITVPRGEAWAQQAKERLTAGGLTAKKMGKQGHRKVEKEIALDPLVLRWEIGARNGETHIRCVLAAGSEVNLNPALLMEALGEEGARITRVRLLKGDGEEWE